MIIRGEGGWHNLSGQEGRGEGAAMGPQKEEIGCCMRAAHFGGQEETGSLALLRLGPRGSSTEGGSRASLAGPTPRLGPRRRRGRVWGRAAVNVRGVKGKGGHVFSEETARGTPSQLRPFLQSTPRGARRERKRARNRGKRKKQKARSERLRRLLCKHARIAPRLCPRAAGREKSAAEKPAPRAARQIQRAARDKSQSWAGVLLRLTAPAAAAPRAEPKGGG